MKRDYVAFETYTIDAQTNIAKVDKHKLYIRNGTVIGYQPTGIVVVERYKHNEWPVSSDFVSMNGYKLILSNGMTVNVCSEYLYNTIGYVLINGDE